jgi:CheY-like chemotaxis protein
MLLDISMPIMNGFEATAAIRAFEAKRNNNNIRNDDMPDDGSPRAVIIALTSLASKRDHDEAFTVGVDEYVVKPVNFKEMGRLLDEWDSSVPSTKDASKTL